MPLTDPVPSSSFDVLERNVQDTDKFVNQETGTFTNRVGKEIKPIPVIEAEANAAIISLGWTPVGEFATGFTYTKLNDVGRDASGSWWRYNGSDLPKVITAGTVPSQPNFSVISFETAYNVEWESGKSVGYSLDDNEGFKQALLVAAGIVDSGLPDSPTDSQRLDALIALFAKISGQTFTGPISATGIKSLTKYGSVIIGDNPVGVPGADWPSTTSLRDATTVSRKLVNEPTDCHAFADKSIIENASDYGGYGAVDVTTILRGNNVHNHVAAYQDRFSYEGSGTLENSWGMIMWPTATGSGTVEKRVGLQLRGISTTTAVVESNRGIDIDPKNSLNENIGVIVRNGVCANSPAISYNSAQDVNGYTFYTSSFGKMQQQGKVGFGAALPTSTPFTFNVAELGSTTVGTFSADSANGAFIAASGDKRVSFISNLSLLGYWDVIANSRAFTPATDNTQPNGQGIKRWSVIHAGTNAITTSDGRLKTFLEIEQAEIAVATKLKKMRRKFKLNDSIKEKGSRARIHFGVNAQEVGQVFRDHGLDPRDYALFCYDSWDDQYVTEQINTGETVEITEIVHEQEFETVIEEFLELKVNEKGEEVYVSLSKEITRPKTIEVPNGFDEEGKPKFKKLPVIKEVINKSTVMAEPIFEQRLETAKGDRYGIRYEQLLAFIGLAE